MPNVRLGFEKLHDTGVIAITFGDMIQVVVLAVEHVLAVESRSFPVLESVTWDKTNRHQGPGDEFGTLVVRLEAVGQVGAVVWQIFSQTTVWNRRVAVCIVTSDLRIRPGEICQEDRELRTLHFKQLFSVQVTVTERRLS